MTDYERDADGNDVAAEPQKGGGGKAPAPNRVGDEVLEGTHLATDHGGTTYRYTGTHWREAPPIYLHRLAFVADGRRRSTSKRRNEIVSYLRAASCQEWEWGRVAGSEIPLRNGVLDVITGELRPHDPADWLESVLPLDYQPGADHPVWTECLEAWWGVESPEAMAVQEYFGYIVLDHAKYKKALVLKGDSNCGKSVVAGVAQDIVGSDNWCSLPVEYMNDPQRRAVIKHKRLNVVSEMSEDSVLSDDGFKALVDTEGPVLIDAKYKLTETYTPRAKHVLCTNVLPKINDRTEGVFNRLLIVPMWRIFSPDEQDDTLRDRLRAELPGILVWAVEGARRLVERRGRWPHVPSADAVWRELRGDANPMADFIGERMTADGNEATPLSWLTDAFNRWGRYHYTTRGVGRLLRSAGFQVRTVKVPGPDGGRRAAVSLVGYRPAASDLPTFYALDTSAVDPDGALVARDATVGEIPE